MVGFNQVPTMHNFPWTARARMLVSLSALFAICMGCRQLETRSDRSSAAQSPTPIQETPSAADAHVPPVPASEARYRGFSPPKALTTPVGLGADAVDTVDHAENAERAGVSQGDDQTDAGDLAIPDSELPVPPPQDVPEGPVADLTAPDVEPAKTNPGAEIDITEFLAELDLVPPPSLKSIPPVSAPGPLPVVAPGRSPLMTPQGVVEDWPRQGLPWNVVVTPAMMPMVQKQPANRPLPASPRLAFENSSWADEPIE